MLRMNVVAGKVLPFNMTDFQVKNYFELFQLSPSFVLDPMVLNQAYRTLQAQYHPDRFVGDDSVNAQTVLQKSADINEAYQVLKSDVRRAEHLLKLQGIDVETERTVSDPELLMQQLMHREQLQEIADAQDESALEVFSHSILQQYQDVVVQIQNAFEQQQWHQAADLATELKFLSRLQQQISDLEDEFY